MNPALSKWTLRSAALTVELAPRVGREVEGPVLEAELVLRARPDLGPGVAQQVPERERVRQPVRVLRRTEQRAERGGVRAAPASEVPRSLGVVNLIRIRCGSLVMCTLRVSLQAQRCPNFRGLRREHAKPRVEKSSGN